MKAEKIGEYHFGFVLNESNVRRIIDTVKEQLLKLASNEEKIVLNYSVKFKNGAVVDNMTIDEILSLDNFGSTSITKLSIKSFLEKSDNSIEIVFQNPEIEKKGYSIIYTVHSIDRDWVFITLSLIQERILLTKRSILFIPRMTFADYQFLSIFGLMFFMFYMFYNTSMLFEKNLYDYMPNKFVFAEKIKEEAAKHPSATPMEANVIWAELREQETKLREIAYDKWKKEKDACKVSTVNYIYLGILSFFIFPIIAFIYSYVLKIVYPVYVFCWGSTQDAFSRKESQRKFLLGTIFTGLLISIVAGLLVNLL
jgi:hypothetical protein